jgi:diguanylate cyclase (GGDEF)-like protein
MLQHSEAVRQQMSARLSGLLGWLRARRTLVAEILSLQVLLTACAGVFAIAGLYWSAHNLLVENVDRWALQWVDELEELGAPLYLDDPIYAFIDVERFANRYPELVRVSWFDSSGEAINTIDSRESQKSPASLSSEVVADLEKRVGSERAHLLHRGDRSGDFIIQSVLWTEQFSGDGLLGLDSDLGQAETRTIGFLELQLDFSTHFEQITASVRLASIVLFCVVIALVLVSNRILTRSLRSLSRLQAPIKRLAQGELDVNFPETQHKEIASIIDTLKSTAETLRERDARLTRLANHDALTGLFNRYRFVAELDRELQRVDRVSQQSAVLFIDLDQFKYVNDTCGHPAGDNLLISAAELLRRCVRETDCIARFGGDEFAILLRNVSRSEAKQIASEINNRMRNFAHVEEDDAFQLQCSIGVTLFKSARRTSDELLAHADLACHEAKRRGRNRVEFFKISAKDAEQMKEDVSWTRRIKQALIDDLFVLHYQPIVHIASGKATHYEVLLRLQLPDGKIISPGEFLPAAERFGLMPDIDQWVIGHAIESLAIHRRENPDLRFTINLSAPAFEMPDLHLKVREVLKRHDVPGEALVFEITEQVAIRNFEDAEKQLHELKEMGCGVAIDDFGTGYSSFSHLKRFRFDYLKIDGSFVEELASSPLDQTMVRLFADIGTGLGVRTVAEFVTDAQTYSLLASYGIDYAQGFHIGRPAALPESSGVAIPIATHPRRQRVPRKADS